MRCRIRVAAALALTGLPLGCDRGPTPAGPDIVLITIDTLRADRLGCYGYFRDTSPSVDAFAREATLFENAIAPIATTLPSHATLMTSTHPLRHGILANLDSFERPLRADRGLRTAAQMLADLGYVTAGFVSATPLKKATGIGLGFRHWDEPEETERRARETTDAVLRWLDTAPSRPWFLWIHYFDPHAPADPPAPFDTMFRADERLVRYLRERRFGGAEHAKYQFNLQNRYDGEVRYVDAEIGRLFADLRARGVWDGAAIVVTADHGEGLGQHGEPAHSVIHNEQLRIPLLLKVPGRPGGRREQGLVALEDVLPALVDELGIPLPEEDRRQFEGASPFRGATRETVASVRSIRPDLFGTQRKFSLQSREWKYCLISDAPDELFDLREDPYELDNVIDAHPDVAGALRRELVARIGTYASRDSLVQQITAPEHLAELRALGYVE